MGTDSTKKHLDCSTTFVQCLEEDAHHKLLDYQLKLKKQGIKRTGLDACINRLIKEKL